MHAWTDDSAQDVIMNFSSGSEVLLAVGFILMTIYAGIAFVNIKSFVMSRVNVGVVSRCCCCACAQLQSKYGGFILVVGGCCPCALGVCGWSRRFCVMWPTVQPSYHTGMLMEPLCPWIWWILGYSITEYWNLTS